MSERLKSRGMSERLYCSQENQDSGLVKEDGVSPKKMACDLVKQDAVSPTFCLKHTKKPGQWSSRRI